MYTHRLRKRQRRVTRDQMASAPSAVATRSAPTPAPDPVPEDPAPDPSPALPAKETFPVIPSPALAKSPTEIIQLIAEHVGKDRSPLLPPDFMRTRDLEDGKPVQISDDMLARGIYDVLKQDRLSCNRQREYVFGAFYKNIFSGYQLIDASLCPDKKIDIKVTLPNGRQSMVCVACAAKETPMLDAIVHLGKALPEGMGNARNKSGDFGEMFALGRRNSQQLYVTNRLPGIAQAMKKASRLAARFMGRKLPKDLVSIRKDENSKKVKNPPLEEMGGEDGPGSCIMISRDLGNSSHFDIHDASRSVGIWVEVKPGMAKNWYFVMPDVSINGSRGVVIRLFHGAIISWDGRDIRHCTSVTEVGEGNHVFGCMFGVSKD